MTAKTIVTGFGFALGAIVAAPIVAGDPNESQPQLSTDEQQVKQAAVGGEISGGR
jgi:hypothetical protein